MIKLISNVRTRLNHPPPKNAAKILLLCKINGLICCLAATIILAFLPSTFLYCCLIAYALPGFVCGYIIVNFIGVITNYSQVDLITDICFSICGICTNLYVSIDIVVDWVLWYSHDPTVTTYISHYGTEFLILSTVCLVNVITMFIQLVYSCRASFHQRVAEETRPETKE
ncbi:uncharacterized protein [Chelonus insularis]|uniref:uncharacterized protein n=1 Tax=Chelonus insularis TaxID=460826 RepID=UPI001589A42F|nr:uncharacterized protein LOC118064189 [Chelonus insularis]